ncbi:MAG TPA: hypothetical protein VFV70_07965 [Hyphomonadaceae bacterium]|nr:hypothetical protein [Hyphomonadaceae bacterium]
MSLRFALFLGGFAALAPMAAAQDAPPVIQKSEVDQTTPPDQIDRVVGPQRGGFRASEGVRVVQPGALLFASFDRNFDGRVSEAEIEAGAAGAFAVADRNGDGVITGFEQNDWATSMASMNDVLSNPMTFDVDLDRQVTPAEFTAGLKRIAGQAATGELSFADLVKPLGRPDEQASRGGPAPAERGQRGSGESPSARN